MSKLVDQYGRRITSMRISITDRCNFRCVYCMPAEGLPWLPRTDILTYEEITRLTRIAASIGVEHIRLTGGEPLVRSDVPELIRQLKTIPDLRSISLTTNGTRLVKLAGPLAEAGLTRINVSLDSLVPHKFFQLARRDAIDAVLAGLDALAQYPTIQPVKVNAVAMKHFTEEEVVAFAEYGRKKGYIIRWIEFMPLDADQIWRKEDILTGGEILHILEEHYGPLTRITGNPAETAQRFQFPDGIGEVGFINPVSEPFCAACDRIRLTAEGGLRTCLFSQEETDLRTLLRNGDSDETIEQALRAAVWQKELKHFIGDKQFRRTRRTMSMIGG